MPTLRNLKIGEVSFCVKGMNQHAKVALFKSADEDPHVAMNKATFAEALQGMLISSKVSDVFWRAFENQWQANDAFKRALIDDLVSGGDGTTPSTDYVMAIAAMAAAAVAAAREIGAQATDEQLEAAVGKAVADYVSTKQETTMTTLTTKALLLAAVAKFDPAKTTLGEVQAMQKAAAEFDCVAELPAAIAPSQADAELAVLKADKARRDAIDAMSADVRKHFDGLDEAGKTAFLAKSATDRDNEVANLNKADPVVFTTSTGIEIRKSDGRTAELLARQNDDLAKSVKALTETGAQTALEKAVAEYPNLAKSVSEPLVKSMLAMEPGAERTALQNSIAAMNKAQGGAFIRKGSSAHVDPASLLPEGGDLPGSSNKLDEMAKAYADANNVTFEKAMIHVAQTPEGAALYAEMVQN